MVTGIQKKDLVAQAQRVEHVHEHNGSSLHAGQQDQLVAERGRCPSHALVRTKRLKGCVNGWEIEARGAHTMSCIPDECPTSNNNGTTSGPCLLPSRKKSALHDPPRVLFLGRVSTDGLRPAVLARGGSKGPSEGPFLSSVRACRPPRSSFSCCSPQVPPS